ncbi:hypothetical protein IFM89_003417 [Coptis chinensis]|uniref:ABC1 atypical kinase-like domain-containing protein n=1 Tax=Coptis chinensis TaxID=261450 RepID=A0A835GWY3_9MAGN|nr:hypothetical protein IFM89_003417 [Coptis chinensis]
MFKFLAIGNIRKARHYSIANYSSEVNKNRPALVTITQSSPFYRFYSLYRYSGRGHTKGNLYSTCAYNNLSLLSRGNATTNHAQTAWKRLSRMGFYRGLASPQISRIARAVTLSLTRSHPVTLGVFSLIFGKLAWRERALADAGDNFPRGNSLYMQAQDGRVYFTSFMFSVLEGFVLFIRAIYLAFLFSPTIAMAPFADSFGVEFRKTWLHLVRVTLEKAGPAFIKWGQWAATRPDLFPRDLCIELSKLHSKAPEHSFAYTKRTIEKAFNRKLREIFDDFEEAPVASGSIAQVHRAKLRYRYPGKQAKPIVVAVKVRHPGVSESIRRDFVIIHFCQNLKLHPYALRWLRLDESVQQFAVFMMSQVDLSREAAHLSRFIYNFRKRRNVSFPKPLYPLVHPSVLVETYEKGESVSRYIDDDDVLVGSDRTKQALAHIGTHALLKMLLVDNFVHADMHPGNILVRVAQGKPKEKGLFKSKPHVIFLDVGMTAELSGNDRDNLLEFFKAVAVRDGRTAAESTLKLSKKQTCPDPSAFIEEVEKSFTFWGTEEGDVVHPAECMHQLLEKVRRHKVNIDGNVCTVMVTMLVLEGWQQKLDPDYNVMKTLQTLLFKAGWAESLEYTIKGLMAP